VTDRPRKADTLRTIVVSATDDEILSVAADDAVVYKGKSITEEELLARCFLK
jgi:hypothetical protein